MLKRCLRWVTAALIAALLFFGIAMLDPFLRQLIFGPRIDGYPLVTWQESFREWRKHDSQENAPEIGLMAKFHGAMGGSPAPSRFNQLSGEDRRAILLGLVNDPSLVVRRAVAKSLAGVPSTSQVAEFLRKCATDEDEQVRINAAAAFGALNPPCWECISELINLLEDARQPVRYYAGWSLEVMLAQKPQLPLSTWLNLANCSHYSIRYTALDKIVELGPQADAAIPSILAMLNHPDHSRGVQALFTLGKLKSKKTLPYIIAALRHDTLKHSARWALGEFGLDGADAIPLLIAIAQDPQSHPLEDIVPVLNVIASMGDAALPAIPDLLELRNHRSEFVRTHIEKTLSSIDPQQFPAK